MYLLFGYIALMSCLAAANFARDNIDNFNISVSQSSGSTREESKGTTLGTSQVGEETTENSSSDIRAACVGDGIYGAIAYSTSANVWGFSCEELTQVRAERLAMIGCGRSDCEAVYFFEACGALAIGQDRNNPSAYYSWREWGNTLAEARTKTLNKCNEGGMNCQIKISFCSPYELMP